MAYPNKQLKEQKSFDEVVTVWLQDEWHEFSDDVKNTISEKTIQKPDFSSQIENADRLTLLKSKRVDIIDKLPPNTKWYSIDLKQGDIERLFLIPMSKGWCFQITDGTWALKRALDNLENNSTPALEEDIGRIRSIQSFADKNPISTRLILIASSQTSSFTVIEGNHRLIAITANALKDKNDIIAEKVYLGISHLMKDCPVCAEKYFSPN